MEIKIKIRKKLLSPLEAAPNSSTAQGNVKNVTYKPKEKLST